MMNEARVAWVNEMQFVAETGSGHALVLESGGSNRAPSPMEMLLVGMAGCTAVDVVHILRRMRQLVTDVQVNVKGVRAEKPPRIYTDIEVEYVVTGRGLSEEKVRRAVELSETTYCSASAMLGKTATITNAIRVLETDMESWWGEDEDA
jgi:putative redox protein